MNEHKRMLHTILCVMHGRGWEVSGESFSSSDVFVHELAVELGMDCVIDEVLLLSRNKTMKDSMNISISHCATEVCSHCSDY